MRRHTARDIEKVRVRIDKRLRYRSASHIVYNSMYIYTTVGIGTHENYIYIHIYVYYYVHAVRVPRYRYSALQDRGRTRGSNEFLFFNNINIFMGVPSNYVIIRIVDYNRKLFKYASRHIFFYTFASYF